jgi:hypothetical protein
MRRFNLVRSEDVSGVSGTGIIAQGIEFDDGAVVMRWFGKFKTTEEADNIAHIIAIHGHEGRTSIEWLDDDWAKCSKCGSMTLANKPVRCLACGG